MPEGALRAGIRKQDVMDLWNYAILIGICLFVLGIILIKYDK